MKNWRKGIAAMLAVGLIFGLMNLPGVFAEDDGGAQSAAESGAVVSETPAATVEPGATPAAGGETQGESTSPLPSETVKPSETSEKEQDEPESKAADIPSAQSSIADLYSMTVQFAGNTIAEDNALNVSDNAQTADQTAQSTQNEEEKAGTGIEQNGAEATQAPAAEQTAEGGKEEIDAQTLPTTTPEANMLEAEPTPAVAEAGTAGETAAGEKIQTADDEIAVQSNDITGLNWTSSNAQPLSVVLTRNANVQPQAGKKYVLCLKVPDILFFSGVPNAADINGVEEALMMENEKPAFYTTVGASSKTTLNDFSRYSGEIRLLLNTTVDTVTIPDIGVSFNPYLVGYGKTKGLSSYVLKNEEGLIQVRIVEVDENAALDSLGAQTVLRSAKVNSAEVLREDIAVDSNGYRSGSSKDGFKTGSNNFSGLSLNRADSFALCFQSAGRKTQTYKKAVFQFELPYITVNGEKHYFGFDRNSTAITNNKVGVSGYHMAGDALVDETNHTITYTFEDIYWGSFTQLIVTPVFTFPEDITAIPEQGYKVEGMTWTILEQLDYSGEESSLGNPAGTTGQSITYLPNNVNVKLGSSAEGGITGVPGQRPYRRIYKEQDRSSPYDGMLGFFDLHVTGTQDTPEVTVKFNFEDEESTAKYFISRVNLPIRVSESRQSITLQYVLADENGNTVDGNLTVTADANTNRYICYATALRNHSGVGSDYYIQSIEYDTVLTRGTTYHLETADGQTRNRREDAATYYGYIEGGVGDKAYAVMSITAKDGTSLVLNQDKPSLISRETSTISENDFIGFGYTSSSGWSIWSGSQAVSNQKSLLITAGNSAKLRFEIAVSSEEYTCFSIGEQDGNHSVNGYHVLRKAAVYICLPEGVSIAGKDQVLAKFTVNNEEKPIVSVEKLEGSECEVNGQKAVWYCITTGDLNITPTTGWLRFDIELATDIQMQTVNWDFRNCIAVRAIDQNISWNGAMGVRGSILNSVSGLKSTTNAKTYQALGEYLEKQNISGRFSALLNTEEGASLKLNIARAEAKLDVETSLAAVGSSSSGNIVISSAETEINYQVTVSSNDGGTASNFKYYIPITKTTAAVDRSSWVMQDQYNLSLTQPVSVTGTNAEHPFEVRYTTQEGLTPSQVIADSVTWTETVDDYSKVTAVSIFTLENGQIEKKGSYTFTLHMKYDNTAGDFESNAGRVDQWRTFGRYTYTRNGATTTNTYPSGDNTITLHCVKDLGTVEVELNTGAAKNSVDWYGAIGFRFADAHTLTIKSVTVSGGTMLAANGGAVGSLTGAAANEQFYAAFNINNSANAIGLQPGAANKGSWAIPANETVTLQTAVTFSKALTDTATERYYTVVVGNDSIDLTLRVNLKRVVAAADATASLLVVGENFRVPQAITDEKIIAQDSAFTALYVVENFVPGNYGTQKLIWQDENGHAMNLPGGTTITMMEISEESKPKSRWIYKVSSGTSTVDLTNFTEMAGSSKYAYATTGTDAVTLRYQFVVNFARAKANTGKYQLAFAAENNEGAAEFKPVQLAVQLVNKTAYGLTVAQSADNELALTANYTVNKSSGDDTFASGKGLALVLTPKGSLPPDAALTAGEKTCERNAQGDFIVPIDNAGESGSVDLTLESQMFPDAGADYSFTAALYRAKSSEAASPMNGEKVAEQTEAVTLTKTKALRPAICVSGTQVATAAEWGRGQDLTFEVSNLDGYTLTATAYTGLRGTTSSQRKTDLLSNIGGVFRIENGAGTYTGGSGNGKLTLNGSTAAGTYRIVFEIRDADGNTAESETYVVVVKR